MHDNSPGISNWTMPRCQFSTDDRCFGWICNLRFRNKFSKVKTYICLTIYNVWFLRRVLNKYFQIKRTFKRKYSQWVQDDFSHEDINTCSAAESFHAEIFKRFGVSIKTFKSAKNVLRLHFYEYHMKKTYTKLSKESHTKLQSHTNYSANYSLI